MNKYDFLYNKLKISIEPLPANYDPESYGRELMNSCYSEQGVSYSINTESKDDDTAFVK